MNRWPGAHYTDQCSYSTPEVGRADSRSGVSESHDTQGSRKHSITIPSPLGRGVRDSLVLSLSMSPRPQSKSVRFRRCDFFTRVTPTTYNFTALNSPHFLEGRAPRALLSPSKTRQNETISHFTKTDSLHPNYLRRSAYRSSHFGFLRFFAFFAAIPFGIWNLGFCTRFSGVWTLVLGTFPPFPGRKMLQQTGPERVLSAWGQGC
jgi:hypothetical protein